MTPRKDRDGSNFRDSLHFVYFGESCLKLSIIGRCTFSEDNL